MKVLLFGTSANPPTDRNGHSGIVDYFAHLGESFSKKWASNISSKSENVWFPEFDYLDLSRSSYQIAP